MIVVIALISHVSDDFFKVKVGGGGGASVCVYYNLVVTSQPHQQSPNTPGVKVIFRNSVPI